MGLFSRKSASASSGKQYPDELADTAQLRYGSQQFASAAETYAKAVDALHTMYVMSDGKLRRPGPQDAAILDGLRNSIGAALSMDANAPVRELAERSCNYLGQIADFADRNGLDSAPYRRAIADVSYEVR